MTSPISTKSQEYLNSASQYLVGATGLDDKTHREDALEVFKKWGLPTKKNENYKYTNLDKIFPETLEVATAGQVTENTVLNVPSEYFLVFDNGTYAENFGRLPQGITLGPFSGLQENPSDPMEALNISMATHKYQLVLEKNVKAPLITIVHRIDSEAGQLAITSLDIVAKAGSEAQFFEVFESQREMTNASLSQTNFTLESNAHIRHTKALLTKGAHGHVGKVKATLKRDAHFSSLTFSVDGKLNRNNVEVFIEETGAHADVNGLYTGRGKQHQDCFTTIHHNAPHTTSNQVFKGILDDESHGVFTGKVIIHRDAQQVDSSQLNNNLLLSKKATVDTRPQIEVYADDVKCGHGATVGQINEEEVFYLESRGIPKEKAQKILCHAFAYEAIESCENEQLAKWLGDKLFELFEKFALENLSLD